MPQQVSASTADLTTECGARFFHQCGVPQVRIGKLGLARCDLQLQPNAHNTLNDHNFLGTQETNKHQID
jgi:hypothetical protein